MFIIERGFLGRRMRRISYADVQSGIDDGSIRRFFANVFIRNDVNAPPPNAFPPPPVYPNGAPSPPPFPPVAIEVAAREEANGEPINWVSNIPSAWIVDVSTNHGVVGLVVRVETEYRVAGSLVPDAFVAAQAAAGGSWPRALNPTLGPGFVAGGELRSTLSILSTSGTQTVLLYWGRTAWIDYDSLAEVRSEPEAPAPAAQAPAPRPTTPPNARSAPSRPLPPAAPVAAPSAAPTPASDKVTKPAK